MNTRSTGTALLAIAAVALAGCAPIRSGDTYYYGQTMRAQSVELGIVEGLRPVRIEGPNTGVGTVGGAALGGIAGAQIGQGSGSVAGAIGGAILGGVLGNAIERDASKREGVEVTVRLDSGRTIAIVQGGTEDLRPGDRVRVVSDGYMTRVTR